MTKRRKILWPNFPQVSVFCAEKTVLYINRQKTWYPYISACPHPTKATTSPSQAAADSSSVTKAPLTGLPPKFSTLSSKTGNRSHSTDSLATDTNTIPIGKLIASVKSSVNAFGAVTSTDNFSRSSAELMWNYFLKRPSGWTKCNLHGPVCRNDIFSTTPWHIET